MTPTPEDVRDCYGRLDGMFQQLEVRLARVQLALLIADVDTDQAIRVDLDGAVTYARTLRLMFADEGINQVQAAVLMTSPMERSH